MDVKPWDVFEALGEVHRRGCYPRSSRSNNTAVLPVDITEGIGRWPEILRACIEGSAMLALSSFGAALFYLQRSLVDAEILSLGIVKAYSPPNTSETSTSINTDNCGNANNATNPSDVLQDAFDKEAQGVAGVDLVDDEERKQPANDLRSSDDEDHSMYAAEVDIDHMALDGTTLSI